MINVNNGYHDYIKNVKAKIYLYTSADTTKNNLQKVKLEEVEYLPKSGTSTEYSELSVINIRDLYPEKYKNFDENNFSFEITLMYTGTANANSNQYYTSTLNETAVTYDKESGVLSLNLNGNNGYHDYVRYVKANVYIFTKE